MRNKINTQRGYTPTPFKKKGVSLQSRRGYTIIETMISISIFIIIVMVGMGSLLNANLVHQKSRDMRSIMDNLSFIIEDMSRSLRTGYNYRCYNDNNLWGPAEAQTSNLNIPRSCLEGSVIVFEAAGGITPASVPPDANAVDQWVYKIASTRTASDGSLIFDISKSTNGGSTWLVMNPSEVNLDVASQFIVSGAESESQNGDQRQPFVTIQLVGKIKYKDITTPFSLQTSVSQRVIDIF